MNASLGSLFRLPNNTCLLPRNPQRWKGSRGWCSQSDCWGQKKSPCVDLKDRLFQSAGDVLENNWCPAPLISVFLQPGEKWQPFTLNIIARTCVEGLCRSANSRGPAQAPAERRGHKPRRVVTAAAARHFLDVLHVLWKKTSMSASNVKSTALYQSMKECEWRIKITKLTDRHTWKWMEKRSLSQSHDDQCGKMLYLYFLSHLICFSVERKRVAYSHHKCICISCIGCK